MAAPGEEGEPQGGPRGSFFWRHRGPAGIALTLLGLASILYSDASHLESVKQALLGFDGIRQPPPAAAPSPPPVLDSPLGRAGAASAFATPPSGAPWPFGPLSPRRPLVDCDELFAAVDAPWDGTPTLGCDAARPAFPAYYACILHHAAAGRRPPGAVVHVTGHYGLGNQLRTAVGTLLYAMATRQPFLSSNRFLRTHFRSPQLPRLVGQSDAERLALEGSHLFTVCNDTASDGSMACRPAPSWPSLRTCTQGGRPSEQPCVDLTAPNYTASWPRTDMRVDEVYDLAPDITGHPHYGLMVRRLFCTASPIRVQAALFSWLLSRPHPELVLAAAALANKLGFQFPRPASVLHGLARNESAAVGAVAAAVRPSACGAGAGVPVVGVQVRALLAEVASTAACTLEGVSVLSSLLQLRERGAAGDGPALRPHLNVSSRASAVTPIERVAPTAVSRVCFWLTADTNASWAALRAPLSTWGPVLIHGAPPSHTMETEAKPDLPALLSLPRTPYLDALKMDVVDFYLLGEVDHMVKADASSFGEYGFLRSGLPRGAAFVRYNMPGRGSFRAAGGGCFSGDAVDAGHVTMRRVAAAASAWGEGEVEDGLAVPAEVGGGGGELSWAMTGGATACRDR